MSVHRVLAGKVTSLWRPNERNLMHQPRPLRKESQTSSGLRRALIGSATALGIGLLAAFPRLLPADRKQEQY